MYCKIFSFLHYVTVTSGFYLSGGDTLDRSLIAVGTVCVAKYHVDELYYRAVVKEVHQDGALVNFVDYGNIETVSSY